MHLFDLLSITQSYGIDIYLIYYVKMLNIRYYLNIALLTLLLQQYLLRMIAKAAGPMLLNYVNKVNLSDIICRVDTPSRHYLQERHTF